MRYQPPPGHVACRCEVIYRKPWRYRVLRAAGYTLLIGAGVAAVIYWLVAS